MAKNQPRVVSSSRIVGVVLALAIVGAPSMIYYHLALFIPRSHEMAAASGLGGGYSWGNDFHPVWLTSRQALLEHTDPYSPEMTRQLQTGVFGRALDPHNPHDPPAQYREYAYPAITALVMWPAALIPFPELRILLAVLLPLLTIITLGLWDRALEWQLSATWFSVIVVLTLTSYQMLEALFAEQLGLFAALFLAGSALAIREERFMLAGALSSLTLMKPETSSLAIFYLLLWSFSDRRRAHFWQGFAIVSFALLTASLLIWPHWIFEWIHVVLGYNRYAMPPLIQVLLGKSTPAYMGRSISVGFIAAAVLLAWRYRTSSQHSPRFWLTLSLILAITCVAVLPGQAIYDHTILLPGIFLVLIHRQRLAAAGRVSHILLYAGALALFWPWIMSPVVLILHHWLPSPVSDSSLLALPIRSAVSLPFAVLALLWWTSRLSGANQATR